MRIDGVEIDDTERRLRLKELQLNFVQGRSTWQEYQAGQAKYRLPSDLDEEAGIAPPRPPRAPLASWQYWFVLYPLATLAAIVLVALALYLIARTTP